MENIEKRQKAEVSLNETERLKRQKESLESERDLFADAEEIERIQSEESIGDVLSMDEVEKMLGEENKDVPDINEDEKINELEEGIVKKLGAEPQAIKGLSGKEFHLEVSESDAWRLASFREDAFRVGMRQYLTLERKVRKAEEAAEAELAVIFRLEKEKNTILSSRRARAEAVRVKIAEKKEEMDKLVEGSPEVFVGSHLMELRQYHRDLDRGRLAEMPYVEKNKAIVMDRIKSGEHLFIYGHLGSGKSELAMAAAREYLSGRPEEEIGRQIQISYDEWLRFHPSATEEGKEKQLDGLKREARGAVVISGSAQLHQSELYGHRALNIKEFFTQERLSKLRTVEEEYGVWEKGNAGASPESKALHYKGLLKVYLDEGTGTFSDFFVGPIYRAMRDGRPVVLDEIDYIKPEVLASLNHILTRITGESVSVQQDSGERVQMRRGFCIIATGNFPSETDVERYVGTQKMNAAFLSRFGKLNHDYLPQSAEPNLTDATPEELKNSDSFHMLLARSMDRYGNISAPKGSIEKLWKFAVFAKKSQDIFSGKWADKETGEAGLTREMVGDEVLSPRHITRIIEAWQRDNMRYELDHYIFERFIGEARDTERAALYKIAQEVGLFSEQNGWPPAQNIEAGAGVVKFEIVSPANEAGTAEWYSPRDTVEYAFGKAPERSVWPVWPDVEGDGMDFEAFAELRAFREVFNDEIDDIEKKVGDYCVPLNPERNGKRSKKTKSKK